MSTEEYQSIVLPSHRQGKRRDPPRPLGPLFFFLYKKAVFARKKKCIQHTHLNSCCTPFAADAVRAVFIQTSMGPQWLEELVLGKGVKNSFFGGCTGGRDKLEVLREEVVE